MIHASFVTCRAIVRFVAVCKAFVMVDAKNQVPDKTCTRLTWVQAAVGLERSKSPADARVAASVCALPFSVRSKTQAGQ